MHCRTLFEAPDGSAKLFQFKAMVLLLFARKEIRHAESVIGISRRRSEAATTRRRVVEAAEDETAVVVETAVAAGMAGRHVRGAEV